MKRLHFEYTTLVEFSAPVTNHHIALRCRPGSDGGQRIEACELTLQPSVPTARWTDVYGNDVAAVDICASHQQFSFAVKGTAVVYGQPVLAGECNPSLRYPGSLTQPGPAIRALYEGLNLSGLSSLQAAKAMAKAVKQALVYTPGVTDPATTAEQALALGKGVCQDYAQILAALCRLHGLPAVYCAGLPEGEGTTHAWTEVLCDGRWVGLDPTRDKDVDDGYIVLARGRDYADCPVEQGTFYGLCSQTKTVFVKVFEEP